MKIFERNPVKIDIDEGAGPSMRLHFLALTSGIPTGNGHRYGGKLLQKASDEFNARVTKYGPAMGGTKHPEGDMNVEDVAMMINKTTYDENTNGLWVDATILPTSKGRSISALLRAGAKIGCSVRGQGEVASDGEVKSFSLKGCDLVLNPSTDNYVSMDNVYESREIPEESQDEFLERYRAAIRAGFRGDEQAFRQVYKELQETKKTEPVGDLHQASIDRSKALPKAADGFPKTYAPGNPQDGEEDESDLAVAEKLLDAIEEGLSKLGMKLAEVDEGETVVFAFNMAESQYYKIPWTLLPDGQVQLGRPEPVEV
jgi:hypothetical protein